MPSLCIIVAYFRSTIYRSTPVFGEKSGNLLIAMLLISLSIYYDVLY